MCNLLRYKDRLDEAYANWEFSEVRITLKLRYRIPPSEPTPVVTVRSGKPQLTMMNFGFATERGRQMMARSETVSKLPTFREAFKHQRCLVMVHGFYDSENMGAYKQPWHLHLKTDALMGFAALWEQRPGEENFTIVSTPANSVVAGVIDRMPAILLQDQWHTWLDPHTPPDTLKSLLVPFDPAPMEAYPVTREVNQKGFDDPACIVPIVPEQGDLGLF